MWFNKKPDRPQAANPERERALYDYYSERRLGVLIITLLCAPLNARADNCGSLSDCYDQIEFAILAALAITLLIVLLPELVGAGAAILTALGTIAQRYPDALQKLRDGFQELAPALADASPAVPELAPALSEALPAVSELAPAATDMAPEVSDLVPEAGEAVDVPSVYHHIFPQEFRPEFERLGIEIDKYLIRMDPGVHGVLHNWDNQWYNDQWGMFFNPEKGEPTADEAIQLASELLNDLGLVGPDYTPGPKP